MMLALHPEAQIKMQQDIDRVLGHRNMEYEQDYQPLAETYIGAVIVCKNIPHRSTLY